MKLTVKQGEYVKNANHRWNVKTGATGAGKTYLDLIYTIPKRIRSGKGKSGINVLMGNTKGTLTRNIIQPMQEIWGSSLVSDIRQDNTATLFGEKVFCLGADSARHVDRVRGATFKYMYGDEVATWNEQVFTIVKSRLREPYSTADLTCNPDNPYHWFKKFIDSDVDLFLQNYIIDDGALDKKVIEELKKEYAGTVYYDRYILGLWASAEGVIYTTFANNPDKFIINNPPNDILFANIGVDFGGGTSAHAFSCVGFTLAYNKLVVLEEYWNNNALTPRQLENDFIEFARMCKQKYNVANVYCDSAEQTLINGLRTATARAVIPLNIYNARKLPVNDRIRCATRLQSAGRFFIMKNCTKTIEAYRTALWNAKDITKDTRLDNGTTNIDSLDATEYAYERHISELVADIKRPVTFWSR